jgi:uncharacterized protein YecE (DUF72 family)
MQGNCFIGTSGWSYDHWVDIFYPDDLRSTKRLAFYVKHFNTVEVNSTFYQLPTPFTVNGWRKTAPQGFIYALKGSRFITHLKKLKEPEKSLQLFLMRGSLLKETLGPILFQLPPRWRCNLSKLRNFIHFLPQKMRYAFEFRDQTWFNKEVYDTLKERQAALCIYDMPEFVSPLEITAPFVYIRFHGTASLYRGRYSETELMAWANRINQFRAKGLDMYVYFNNDAYGYAIDNAKELREMLG